MTQPLQIIALTGSAGTGKDTAANRLVPVPAEVIHPHVGAHADGFQRRPVRMAGAFRWEEIDAIIVALTAARAV